MNLSLWDTTVKTIVHISFLTKKPFLALIQLYLERTTRYSDSENSLFFRSLAFDCENTRWNIPAKNRWNSMLEDGWLWRVIWKPRTQFRWNQICGTLHYYNIGIGLFRPPSFPPSYTACKGILGQLSIFHLREIQIHSKSSKCLSYRVK